MGKLSFFNAMYFAADGQFHNGGFCVEDGRLNSVGPNESANADGIDLKGAHVIPGLIDLHTHGCAGYDFSSCSENELKVIARAHAKAGAAGFLATSMTLPEEELKNAFKNAANLFENRPKGAARVLGINMEGPFFSQKRKGAQNGAYLKNPDKLFFSRLQDTARGCIRLVDVAVELPGAMSFINGVKGEVTVSLAHTDASYSEALKGFDAGISHVTHLFNAMPSLTHRAPGPIAAAAERENVTVELIADGVHIHESVVRLAFKMFGANRICLISDSLEACGMKEGIYNLGGQTVNVKGALATLEDGTIAGSVAPVYRCMQNVITWGIPKEQAVRAASLTPAKRLSIDNDFGSITDGKIASFLIVDEHFNIKNIYIEGEEIKG